MLDTSLIVLKDGRTGSLQVWSSGKPFRPAREIRHMSLPVKTFHALSHFIYERSGMQQVAVDFKGHQRSDGFITVFNAKTHTITQ